MFGQKVDHRYSLTAMKQLHLDHALHKQHRVSKVKQSITLILLSLIWVTAYRISWKVFVSQSTQYLLAIEVEEPQQEAPIDFATIVAPQPNEDILGYFDLRFYGGLCNQLMTFYSFILYAQQNNYTQILLPTLHLKELDIHGMSRYLPFEKIFNIAHWNSYYPKLPRLVSCDQSILTQFSCKYRRWTINKPEKSATRPYAFGTQPQLFGQFKRYTYGKGPLIPKEGRRRLNDEKNIAEALQPVPELQLLFQTRLKSVIGNEPYMALHARVEPDMLRHVMCQDKKEQSLEMLFHSIEKMFPEPPAQRLFIALNRKILEDEVQNPPPMNDNVTNALTVANLNTLNDAVRYGLWGGRVKVFELGVNAIKGTSFHKYPIIMASLLDYTVAVDSKIFIGTEISSWSVDVAKTRHFLQKGDNYRYRPNSLEVWTGPPEFHC